MLVSMPANEGSGQTYLWQLVVQPLDKLLDATLSTFIRLDRKRSLDDAAHEVVVVVRVDVGESLQEGVDGKRDVEHLLSLLVGGPAACQSRALNCGDPVLEEARVELGTVAGGNDQLPDGQMGAS